MNDKIVFGQYYFGTSWIHKLDPRSKLLAVLLFMISIFLIDSFTTLGFVFLGIIIIILTSQIPIFKFLSSIKTVAYLLLFTFACQVLFRKTGEVIKTFDFTLTVLNLVISVILLVLYFASSKIITKFRFMLFITILLGIFISQIYIPYGLEIVKYSISIYDDSLYQSGFIILRIIMILLMSSLLTFSTKPTDLNNGLEKLLSFLKIFKINPAIIAMIMSIALREIPKLINEADKVLKAQASRGVDFKEAKIKDKIMQIVSLIVPMFIISYQIADDLSDAMEARGYDPSLERTNINVLVMKLSDYLCIILMSLFLISTIIFI